MDMFQKQISDMKLLSQKKAAAYYQYSKATENEMLALNAYLIKEGKLDGNVYSSSVLSGADLSDADVSSVMNLKKNFFSNVKEMMEMQYNAHNFAGYAQYKKIWDVYDLFMSRK